MAILASIEVDDEGSLKIRNFRDALSDLGASVVKAKQEMANANASGAASTRQQVDALSQLTAAARAAYSEQQKYGQGFSTLSQQLKAGATVSQVQADALRQLASQTQTNTKFTQNYGAELANLVKQVTAGAAVTPELAKSLNSVAAGYQNATKGANEASTGLGAFSLKAAAVAAALGLFAGEALGLLKESGELAARVQVLGTVMSVVAKNARLSNFEMEVQVEKIKRLGITTQEATNSVIQFVQANLKAADASKVARVAQDLAVIAGVNSSQAFQTLTAAIQTQQPMLLRQFGIVTGLDQIYTEFARSVGKTVKTLDDQEKKQAVLNKILSEGEKVAGAYEAAMGDVGKQMTSLARYTEEAKLKLGQALLPVMMLIVETVTAMLKAFTELPPGVMAAVTALLAFAAAAATVSSAIAGAKFIGALEMFAGLRTGIMGVVAAISSGGGLMAVFEAIVALLGGPVTATIILVTAAVAAITAGYIAWTGSQEASTEELTKQVAATQASIDKIDDLVKSIDMAAAAGFRNGQEQEAYNKKIDQLRNLVPGAVGSLNTLTGTWDLNRDAIDANTASLRENLAEQKKLAEASIAKTISDLGTAMNETKAKSEEYVAVLKNLRNQQAQGADPKYIAALKETAQRLYEEQQALVKNEAALRAKKQVEEGLIGGFDRKAEAAKNSRKAIEDETNALFNLGKTDQEVLARLKKANLMDEFNKLISGTKVVQDLDANHQRITKTVQMTAEEIAQMGQKISQALTKAEADAQKKAVADAKRYQATFEGTYAKIVDLTKTEKAQFAALDKALGESGQTQEEYNRRVQAGNAILQDYSKKPDLLVKKFKNLEAGYQSLLKISYESEFTGRVEKITKQFADLNQASLASVTSFTEEFRKTSEQADKKLELDQRAQAERIYDANRSIYEKLVVSKMKAVDQEIYAENKRIEDIVRGAAKEKKAREDEIDAARKVVDEKAILLQREIQDKVDKIRLDAQLEDAAAVASIQRNQKLTDDEKAARIRGIQDAAQVLNNQLNQYQQVASARVEIARGTAQAEIDQRQKTVTQMNVLTDVQTKREIDASGQVKKEIIKNHSEVRAAVISITKQMTQDFIGGLMEMGPGAKSFKDVLVGVFDGIKKSFFSMVNSMVQNWIDGMFKMKAAGGALDGATSGGGAGGVGSSGGLKLFGKGQSAGQRAMSGAAVGFMAGDFAGRYADGSYAKGALGGAASGAAAGGAVGGWVGAGVGAIAGGIAGYMQARAQRKQMQADRDQMIKDMGGLEAFKKKAQEAGFAYEKLLSTKSPKDFGAEVKKLQESLDKLELKKSREELIKTSGGLAELSKKMQLVGFDSTKLFQTKSVSEYNSEVERLNKLLEEQQKRLEALGSAAGGLNAAVQGMSMRLGRTLDDIVKKMSKAEADALAEAFKKAQEGGFKGSQGQFLGQQAKLYQTAQEGDPRLKTWLSGDTMTAFLKAQKDAQKEFNNLGLVATATFGAILQETGDIVQAMNAVGDSLDQMAQLQADWGLTADGSFQKLLQFRQVIKDNEDIATSLSGITQILKGLGEAGALDTETFNAMGNNAALMFQTLLDRGVDSQQALLLMQPTLQALWQAQKDYGFAADETTQKLIDQGVEAGMVGERQQSINKQMLDVLLIIAKALGADIPTAYQAMAGAADAAGQRAGGALGGVRDRAREARQALEEMGDAAEDAGRRAEDSATRAAEGSSPTGIKQIIVRLNESMDAFKAFKTQAVSDSGNVEDAAAAAADQMAAMQKIRDSGVTPDQLREIYAQAAAANGGNDPTRTDTVRPGGSGDSTQPAPNLTVQVTPEFTINALDGSDVERIVRDSVGPELLNLALANTDQFAILFEQALERYRRGQ